MQPVDLSSMAQNLGPGTGGQWLGEQQRNAMQESELNQQNTLEQIATAKQNRDINMQKLPGELEKQKLDNAGQGIKNTSEQNKLDKDNYTNYSNDVLAYAAAGHSPIEIAAYQDQAAKRHKLDPQDERVSMVGGIAAQGTTAIAKWKEVMLHMDPEYRKDMDKQRLANEGSNTSASIHTAASIYAADRQLEAERERIAAGKYNKTSRQLTADQEIDKAKTAVEKHAKLIDAAMIAKQNGDQEAYINYMTRAQAIEPQAKAELQARGNPQGINLPAVTGMQSNPEVNIAPSGATPPPQAQQAPAAGVTKVSDDAGYAALPSKALFVGPDGVTRRKP